MTTSVEALNELIEKSLYTILLPTVAKILIATVMPGIIGLIVIIVIKKSAIGYRIKDLIVIVIRFVMIIAMAMSGINAIQNVEIPMKLPEYTEGGDNPFRLPEYTEGGDNPFKLPEFTEGGDNPFKPPEFTEGGESPFKPPEFAEGGENPRKQPE